MKETNTVLAVKERPISLHDWEVRAILEGRKTQFRRAAKFGHSERDQPDAVVEPYPGEWIAWWTDMTAEQALKCSRQNYKQGDGVLCPFGKVGERLWLREPHWRSGYIVNWCGSEPEWHTVSRPPAAVMTDEEARDILVRFEKPEDDSRWCRLWPAAMPRWASRILLEITGVRVERLQDISEEDAEAEGVVKTTNWDHSINEDGAVYGISGTQVQGWPNRKGAFEVLWRSLNGPGSWDANPWVWAVSFKPITALAAASGGKGEM